MNYIPMISTNKLEWVKMGKIFDPTQHKNRWMQNYAQNPNVLELSDRLRIYFTTRPNRDKSGNFTSFTCYADFEKKEPFNLIEIAPKPVLDLGNAGDFDEFGIMPGSLVEIKEINEIWLYYVGWTRLTTVPYKWSIGIAISKNGGKSFQRLATGPIISSSHHDPYLQACPRVFRIKDNSFVMWYNAGTEWNLVDGHYESVYITKTAISKDGIHWKLTNKQVIPSKVEKECQTSASYIQFNRKHHLFFSYRHGIDFRGKDKGYRIGYMWSKDNIKWTRDDALSGIDVSLEGWDSEMICYPHVVELNDQIFLFYCGNSFGVKGFGYAKLIIRS